MIVNTTAIAIQVIMTLLMGRLSDYAGRKSVLRAGIIGLMALAYPIFWLLTQHDIYLALLAEVLFALAAGVLTGLIPTTLAEMFNTYHRNMWISISYNVSLALFGGTASLVVITLVASTHNLLAPAWYLMGFGIVALLALRSVKESYQKSFLLRTNDFSVY